MEEVKSKSFVLYNLRERVRLNGENSEERLPVASLTKMMTALVVLEDPEMEMGRQVEITDEMLVDLGEWAKVGLRPGQTATVEDLLYALMLPSAGDAGQALAVASAGSIEAFAEKMNQKAEELGLNNTHFSNPIGRDEDNYSTAEDMAALLMAALKKEEFKKIFEANEYEFAPLGTTIYKTVNLENNALMGAKTGFTYEAGRCLASTARLNGVDYLLVVMGAGAETQDHVADTRGIYNYYGTHYGYRKMLDQDEEIWRVPVMRSRQGEYVITVGEWEYFAENEDDLADVEWEMEVLSEINWRVKEGDTIGVLSARRGEEEIYRQEVYLEQEIEYWNMMPVAVIMGVAVAGFALLLGLAVVMKKWKTWLLGLAGIITGAVLAVGLGLIWVNEPQMEAVIIERENVSENVGEVEEIGEISDGEEPEKEETVFAEVSAGANYTVGWGSLMLINPNFVVPEWWIGQRRGELVNISDLYGIREGNIYNGVPLMDAEAAEHLAEMLRDYTAAYPGHEMTTRSCFRSVGTTCGRLCYATGTSDHHSGYTCDLIDDAYGGVLDTDLLANHPEWRWLKENSYKYGFIDRFPEAWAGGPMSEPVNVNAEGSTGLYETWHYRYVGLNAAAEIASGKYNNGNYDSLEHYLKATGRIGNLLNR